MYPVPADLDLDGDTDLVAASQRDNRITWYQNNGAGNFTTNPIAVGLAVNPLSVHAADIEGDGDIDLLLGTEWLELGGHAPIPHTLDEIRDLTSTDNAPGGVPASDRCSLADIDGDGRLDAVVGFEGATDLLWYAAPADPTQPWIRHGIAQVPGGVYSMHTADMDADGDMDVVVGEHRAEPGQPELADVGQPVEAGAVPQRAIHRHQHARRARTRIRHVIDRKQRQHSQHGCSRHGAENKDESALHPDNLHGFPQPIRPRTKKPAAAMAAAMRAYGNCVRTWSMWSVADAIEASTVVSLIGEA